jgi:hypothetical protein
LGRSHTESYLNETTEKLQAKGIGFYYAETFPEKFELK